MNWVTFKIDGKDIVVSKKTVEKSPYLTKLMIDEQVNQGKEICQQPFVINVDRDPDMFNQYIKYLREPKIQEDDNMKLVLKAFNHPVKDSKTQNIFYKDRISVTTSRVHGKYNGMSVAFPMSTKDYIYKTQLFVEYQVFNNTTKQVTLIDVVKSVRIYQNGNLLFENTPLEIMIANIADNYSNKMICINHPVITGYCYIEVEFLNNCITITDTYLITSKSSAAIAGCSTKFNSIDQKSYDINYASYATYKPHGFVQTLYLLFTELPICCQLKRLAITAMTSDGYKSMCDLDEHTIQSIHKCGNCYAIEVYADLTGVELQIDYYIEPSNKNDNVDKGRLHVIGINRDV